MERVSRHELLATIRADRARFDRILDGVPRERLEEPMLPGGWSVKDVLWHVAWGDREGTGMIRAGALIGSDLWELPQDERNEIVVSQGRSRTLDEVIAEYRSSFDGYVTALEELSDDELNDADRFPGLPERIPGWRPWRVVYDPEHYDDHGRAIASALGRRPGRR